MNISDLEKYDSEKMYKIYDKWPNIARESFNIKQESINFKNIDHIVFAGMGGSGAIGNLFGSIFSKSDIHVTVVKGYVLPNTITENTLVVVTSVSGNTLETLSILESAEKINCNLIVFSSGGKIEKLCKNKKILFRNIPFIHSPRASFINFTYSIIRILEPIIPISRKEIIESLDALDNIKKEIDSQNLSSLNPAIDLANWISGIPIIYYPHGLESSATRFKSSLQENSKIHVMIEDVIEVCHNGIVAWEKSSNVQPILLQGHDDHIKTKERFELIKKFFKKNNIKFKEIRTVSGNILTKIICLIYLLDYASIYLSILTKIDPSPVLSIDYIKNLLNE